MPVALHGVAATQVQDLAFGLIELHAVVLSPLIESVKVSLVGLSYPQADQHSHPTYCL